MSMFSVCEKFSDAVREKLVSSNGGDIVIKMAPMLQMHDDSLVIQRVDQVRVLLLLLLCLWNVNVLGYRSRDTSSSANIFEVSRVSEHSRRENKENRRIV
jgi:hypothetical protein